ncbi:MAG TPA: lamin tail domain-containing protein, partial [Bacteroidales bacterium]|nr:lamin tail domain-containing protein [Bacteroidales bacterium]
LLGGTCYDDKTKYKATITSLRSNIYLNHVTVESSHFPFYSEFGTVSILNSRMTSPKTCDLINIKYAKSALVENCDLPGNDYPDTDAIDYDSIYNGIIRNNTIYGFFGLNSDAIDIGEKSSDVLIESNRIFNMTDKGISIGQGSSAIIKNNIIYGCNMGVGIKDSNSFAYIDHNTFYGNTYGIAVYEKSQNSGGGGAEVINCIFSGSIKKPILVDSKSWISVVNSLSDKKKLDGRENIYGNPEFEDAMNFNFTVKEDSLAHKPGKGKSPDIGAKINIPRKNTPEIVINEINFSPIWKNNPLYWIELYNNSDVDVDLTGWTVKNENHNIYALPQKLIIKKNGYIILTNNYYGFLWHYPNINNVRGVLDDKIITKGDAIMLYDTRMNLVDYVDYKSLLTWPNNLNKTGASLVLKAPSLDSNQKSNWKIDSYSKGTPGIENKSD